MIIFTSQSATPDLLIIGMDKDKKICVSSAIQSQISALQESLTDSFLRTQKFEGNTGDIAYLGSLGNSYPMVILVGLGAREENKNKEWIKIGGQIAGLLQKFKATQVEVAFELPANTLAFIAQGLELRHFAFDKYLEKKAVSATIQFVNAQAADIEKAFAPLSIINEGVFKMRRWGCEPANILTPARFAEAVKEYESLGVHVTIFDENEIKKQRMGALIGVAQGSINPPRFVLLEWKGGHASEAPLAFVGKGVTFDSGGISIKPADGMEEMKYDMMGAATVAGLLYVLAARKAPVNAIGVLALVENMPSGTAQRPGDIVTALSGKTIEVLNTDAEGRLILADALWYTQQTYKPKVMIDLATLTGAVVVALGHEYAGIFTHDDQLANELVQCGEETNEKVWRLPLDPAFAKHVESKIADYKNIAGRGVGAGSIMGAQFLEKFVGNSRWLHIDIAGVAYTAQDGELWPQGPSGFGLRLLNEWVDRFGSQ